MINLYTWKTPDGRKVSMMHHGRVSLDALQYVVLTSPVATDKLQVFTTA